MEALTVGMKGFGRFIAAAFIVLLISCNSFGPDSKTVTHLESRQCTFQDMLDFESDRITERANRFLSAEIRTVTADLAERSAGGPHDFFSEGDYWWPVPGKPDAPYERRDGQSNPDNFIAHRLSMMNLADYVGTFATAHIMTGNRQYADTAAAHLRAWFINPETRMNPNLFYGQAIKGRHTGRSIGIIDTMHLVDVAIAAHYLIQEGLISEEDTLALKQWFADYADWMNTHPMGVKESLHPNNHSIAWSMQIAAFATLTADEGLEDVVRDKFLTWYLPDMMAADGSFPKETARTKPYGYSVFVYDLMAAIAQLASDETKDLWHSETQNGRSMQLGAYFIVPFMKDREGWPFTADVQYADEPDQRRAFLLFGALAFKNCDYFELAKTFDPDSEVYEIRRNMPIRSPLLWIKVTQAEVTQVAQ